MKIILCYDESDDSPHSVNFVDSKNRFVGFSLNQKCCEMVGWKFEPYNECYKELMKQQKTSELFDMEFVSSTPENFIDKANELLSGFDFSDNLPIMENNSEKEYKYDNSVKFALDSNSGGSIYLVLSNVHNGYYSHGFEFNMGKNKGEDCL